MADHLSMKEILRLTSSPERDQEPTTDAKPVEVGEIVRHIDALTGYFSAVGMNGEEYLGPILNARTAILDLQAEVARLTQENARLAGEVAVLTREVKQTAYLRANVADGEEPPR